MSEQELPSEVRSVLSVDPGVFGARVEDGADFILDAVDTGVFDNPQAIIGFEYEFYAVAEPRSSARRAGADGDERPMPLKRVPRRLLEFIGFEKELGLHNAEMSTAPIPLNADGLRAQETEVLSKLRAAQTCVGAEGMRLVSDGLWTVPPVGETAAEYLTDTASIDGITVGANMSEAPRYHAISQSNTDYQPRFAIDAPHVHVEGRTMQPESLITSIQPHYQVPQAVDLPTYFRYAVRVAAPLLALGVNSPLFPPDLYDDAPPGEILDDAHRANRIRVFESVMNDPDARKVRFPRDVDSVEDAVRRVVEDDAVVPMPPAEADRFDDQFAAYRQKHGTFWRWVRPVFEGATRESAHARIEFRPIGAQPTVRDSIAFQAAFAGLMESLPRLSHPVGDLDWEAARDNFYAAMADGLDADLEWRSEDGERLVGDDRIYEELLAHARNGLETRGVPEEQAEQYLYPLRKRVRHDTTPASWKLTRVRERMADGESFADAVRATKREYVDRQRESLLEGSFADWIDDRQYSAG